MEIAQTVGMLTCREAWGLGIVVVLIYFGSCICGRLLWQEMLELAGRGNMSLFGLDFVERQGVVAWTKLLWNSSRAERLG